LSQIARPYSKHEDLNKSINNILQKYSAGDLPKGSFSEDQSTVLPKTIAAIEEPKTTMAIEPSGKTIENKAEPSEAIQNVITFYSNEPLLKKSTKDSSNSTTMIVKSPPLDNGSPLYSLKGRLFTIHDNSLEERDKNNLEIVKLYRISPNIAEILFNKNPLQKQYSREEIGQYLRILEGSGRKLTHAGDKLKSVFNQLSVEKKPALKDIPSYSGQAIQFLPSDPKLLFNRLFILLGSTKAGNDNTRNEIISIMDNLLQKKYLTQTQYNDLHDDFLS
jgi:hypothetical protein